MRIQVGVLIGMTVLAAPTRTAAQDETLLGNRKLASPQPLMTYLAAELAYTMEHMTAEDGTKPFYLNYTAYEEHTAAVSASLGAITQDQHGDERNLNIDLRVGDYPLDNPHQLRGGGPSHVFGSGNIALPLGDDADAVRHELWYHT